MVATVGTSTNINTESSHTVVSVGSSVAVTLVASQPTPVVQPRIKVIIGNRGNRDLAVRLYSASDDNIFRDIVVKAGETKILLEGSDIYTGEISGIMQSGGARDVFVTVF